MIITDTDEMLARIDAAIAQHEEQIEQRTQELYRAQGERRLLAAMQHRDNQAKAAEEEDEDEEEA